MAGQQGAPNLQATKFSYSCTRMPKYFYVFLWLPRYFYGVQEVRAYLWLHWVVSPSHHATSYSLQYHIIPIEFNVSYDCPGGCALASTPTSILITGRMVHRSSPGPLMLREPSHRNAHRSSPRLFRKSLKTKTENNKNKCNKIRKCV